MSPPAEELTEYWLEPPLGLAIRMAPGAKQETNEDTVTVSVVGRRFGDPSISLGRSSSRVVGRGGKAAQLSNGGQVTYQVSRDVDHRVLTARLDGRLRIFGQDYDLRCTMYKEVESGADPAWCLPYLATLRRVHAKP